jgi:mediator of RNA polymerase II transcription subunit 14
MPVGRTDWILFKVIGGADLGSILFLKIEPGHNQHIICSHNTFVIDPKTGNEVEFMLNQSFIDVERLLLRAISCILHTHLLGVLKSNSQLCQYDIILS